MRGDSWNYRPRRWHDSGDLLVQVKTRSYRRFSRWMDRRLTRLVQRWAWAAAPNAVRRRRRRRPGKPKPK